MARYLVVAIKSNRDPYSCAFRISIIHELARVAKRAASIDAPVPVLFNYPAFFA